MREIYWRLVKVRKSEADKLRFYAKVHQMEINEPEAALTSDQEEAIKQQREKSRQRKMEARQNV